MMDERSQHMQRAARLLESVETRAASDDPGAVVSTAYYAMFHAACAVLLHKGERLPKTHSSPIGRFGLAVRELGSDGREAGAALHTAFNRRFTADYTVAVQLGREDALKARNDAHAFISYCRKLQRQNGL
jgi:uncharacterized protein (UPF0332 family)